MVFIIKKILQIIVSPTSVIFLILIASIILISLKKKWGKRLLILAVALYYLLAIGPTSDFLISRLENSFSPVEIPPPGIRHVVVLGGGTTNFFSKLPATSRLTPSSMARILEGVRLFRYIENGVLIASGGGLRKYPPEQYSCEQMKRLANELGVDNLNITTECESRDTYEEAKEIKQMLKEEPFILVTSAFHMPRSIYIFKKIGLKAVAAPCDFKAQSRVGYHLSDFWPKPQNLHDSSLAIKEYVGRLAYCFYK